MPAEPIVAAHAIHVHYAESEVLRGVSLSIGPGESVGLLGRNGMGKTTLIRALMGFVATSRGEIAIRGSSKNGARPDRVARAGVADVAGGGGLFLPTPVR